MEKIVNGSVFIKKKSMWVLYKEAPSSRKNSWITFEQICKEYPEFIDKLCDIVTCPQYQKKGREFAKSILDYIKYLHHTLEKDMTPWLSLLN